MHMVRHQMALHNPALFLLGQAAENIAQMLSYRFIQNSPSAFREEGYVVFALPYRLT
jgi:hypothetical protein